MLREVQAPEGRVWMVGADSYLSLARAWSAAGDPARAGEILDPLVTAARAQGWRPVLAQALLERALVARAVGDQTAGVLADESLSVATGAGMSRVADRASAIARS
jgi:hypothetical protein